MRRIENLNNNDIFYQGEEAQAAIATLIILSEAATTYKEISMTSV